MIVIIGDSWGVGEFDKQSNLSGPGFGQYLMLHDRVVNLSVGAGSNSQSLDRLAEFLESYSIDPRDTIYWIVTCPSRCSPGAAHFLRSNLSIQNTALNLLYQAFDRANILGQRYHTRLNLIGGLCDLNGLSFDRWPNLHCVVPSWSQLISPGCSTGVIDPAWWTELGEMIKRDRLDLLAEWLAISAQILLRQQVWNKIFPTNRCHPDRIGHLKLRDHLYPEWTHKT